MSKPTEADLRRAKDNAERVVTEQQRQLGVPDPGGRVVEDFVKPIIEKIARGPKEKRRPADDEEKTPGPPLARDEDVEVTELGTYEWNLRTNQFVATPGSYIPTPQDRLRLFVRGLLQIPEVNALMLAVGRMCEKHTNIKQGCTMCARREERFRQVLRQCAVKYGYARTPTKVFSIAGGK